MNSEKKVCLITGGSRGIGKAICFALAETGMEVIFSYHRNEESAMQVVKSIKEKGGFISMIKCDVSKYPEVQEMVTDIIKKYKKIDVLINNAGITKDTYLMMMSAETWKEVIETNLYGVFNCCKAVIKYMIERKNGRIINIASVGGIIGIPGQTNYTAAKGGIISFTKSLAKELAYFNIIVNVVAPGYIETDMLYKLPEKLRQEYIKLIPLKRFGQPEEVANVVKFLATESPSYLTGKVIEIDGGLIS